MSLTKLQERYDGDRRHYFKVRYYAERWRRCRPSVRTPDDDPKIPDDLLTDVCLWLWSHPQ